VTLALYRAATWAGLPLIRLYLAYRRGRGKEDRARFGERLGIPGCARPEGPLIWAHAASVGESLALLPLIARIRILRPDAHVLMTTGTMTSARLLADRLPAGAFHQFVPVDRRAYVRRFLDHWRPDLVLWSESEFWPNLVSEPAARGIPMILVQGRVSDRSLAGWRRSPALIQKLLAGFALCLAQSEDDARRLETLGARRIVCRGNLKFAAPALPADDDELARLTAAFKARPRWLAASTHPGEEALAARVHQHLKKNHPGLLTLVVPRHPERGPAIAEELGALGLKVAQRSAAEPIVSATDIYLADTLGELGLFYRLAPLAFVGKSLVPLGGQNPLEPARLGCAVVHGPHMTNFADIVRRMTAAGASLEVADEAALAAAVDRLLTDEPARTRLAAAAQAFAAAEGGALDAAIAELKPYLEGLPHARA
jgi:3-deoxy-D-manno-octulosonic-acid transferase